MMDSRRVLDILFSLLLLAVLAPVLIGLSLWLLVRQGQPVFHLSERMRTPVDRFRLIKFRTMTVSESRESILGGDKQAQVTSTGQWMRRSRLDELPQLWNILKGELSFVGPRPPLPSYVQAFPEVYGQILTVKPGVTGLASLAYRRREVALLAQCRTAASTDAAYVSRCIPQKARLDRHYIKTRTLIRDALLVFQTIGDLVRRV